MDALVGLVDSQHSESLRGRRAHRGPRLVSAFVWAVVMCGCASSADDAGRSTDESPAVSTDTIPPKPSGTLTFTCCRPDRTEAPPSPGAFLVSTAELPDISVTVQFFTDGGTTGLFTREDGSPLWSIQPVMEGDLECEDTWMPGVMQDVPVCTQDQPAFNFVRWQEQGTVWQATFDKEAELDFMEFFIGRELIR